MRRALFALAFASLGLVLAASPIVNPALSSSEGGAASTHFAASTAKIYGVAHILGKAGTPVRVEWVADRVSAGVKPGYVIATLDKTLVLTSGEQKSNIFTFSLSRPTAGWPTGNYHVALFLAAGPGQVLPKTPAATLPFSISK